MDEYTGTRASHDDLMGGTITTTISNPSCTIDTSPSDARRASGPIQELTSMLSSRKPCCVTRPGSQDPQRTPGSGNANTPQDEDQTVPEQSSSTNKSTTRVSDNSGAPMSMLEPIQPQMQRRSPAQIATRRPDVVPGIQAFGLNSSENASQVRWQQFQQMQDQRYNIQQQMPQTQIQAMPRHSHAPSYSSDAAISFPMSSSSYPIYSPTFVPQTTDPTLDMSDLLPHDIQAQFLRGLDSNNTSYNTSVTPHDPRQQPHQHAPGVLPSFTGDFHSEFKIEDDTVSAIPTDWQNFPGVSNWPNQSQTRSGRQNGGNQWSHG